MRLECALGLGLVLRLVIDVRELDSVWIEPAVVLGVRLDDRRHAGGRRGVAADLLETRGRWVDDEIDHCVDFTEGRSGNSGLIVKMLERIFQSKK